MNWPTTAAEALAVQAELRDQVDRVRPGPSSPQYVAGLDVAHDGDDFAAAVVVLDGTSLVEVDRAVVRGRTAFPYVPGLFAFREIPGLLDALGKLRLAPELLVCDGQGLAHPRRFGLACHLGVLTGIPTIGVGKTAFVGTFDEPGSRRGESADLLLDGEVVGKVLRTQDGVKPVFVSVGHRVSLDNATRLVLRFAPKYRLPETTRAADHACRAALAS